METLELNDSFCAAHTLAYSVIGLQEMNLAYNYPILFWNCANIIVDSMATDLIVDNEDEIGYLEDDDDEEEVKAPVNYSRIAKAIGKMTSFGVTVRLPDINKSKLTFSPNVEENSIYYGIKGISKINDKITEEIVLNRPYSSPQDFFSKVKLNKPQAVNIIKSGALDCFGDRVDIMKEYIGSISDVKKDLNLRNMQMLISYKMIPDELDLERRIFNFNKYIKKSTFGEEYYLTQKAYEFIEENFTSDMVDFFDDQEEFIGSISKKEWDKMYTRAMDPVRNYIKSNKQELLDELNGYLMEDMWNKYALGSLSKWEMDSVSFYYHEHELAHIRKDIYCISNFFELSEEPEEDYSFTTRDGYPVSIHKLARIAGTVLGKDKTKHNLSLLTEEGVVNVKIWNSQFAKFDKQISELQSDGKKKVIEKSWFSRGNKLILTGIRRGNDFIPKTYKKSEWQHPIQLITDINDNGLIEVKNEREGD